MKSADYKQGYTKGYNGPQGNWRTSSQVSRREFVGRTTSRARGGWCWNRTLRWLRKLGAARAELRMGVLQRFARGWLPVGMLGTGP